MKKISDSLILQKDQFDCGVACLASIIKFHGGRSNLEQLRKLSGTSRQGTTLLGLMQAAKKSGFYAEGLEAESVHNLKQLQVPAILHVIIEGKLQHYVVYYPSSSDESNFLIGDPAKGIIEVSAAELDGIWQSKALLKLVPSPAFEKEATTKNKKKEWIWSLMKDDFHLLLISLFLGIIISVLGISTSIFSQKLIDDILPKENSQKLLLSLALVTLLLFARSGLAYVRGRFMITQSQDFNNRIIQRFFGDLLHLPKSFFDTRKMGELIARMNDTRRIQSVFSVIVGGMVIDFLVVLVSLGFLFSYSPAIGSIMLSCLPIYALILLRYNKLIVSNQKEVMIGYAMAESNFIDTMQGVADIKLMNKHRFFENINAAVYKSFQKRIADLGKVSIRFNWVSEATGIIFIMGVFGAASWLVLSKELKLGEMVALLSMAGNVIPSINRMMLANIQLQEAFVAFDRMFEFSSIEKEYASEKVDNSELQSIQFNIVKLHNVCFRFTGRKQILNNVTLQFKKGEMVALLGESGGGKSTLLNIIQKFYPPEAGLIEIDGHDLQRISILSWRKQIAIVPQELKIFNGNLLYNITLSDEIEDYQEAVEFCEAQGFGRYFQSFPQGYTTLLGEEGINLSGGQKQLVVLARALFCKPQLLLLDEATSAMDRHTENFILELLQKAKKEMAILLVTHRIKTAQRCDRVYILENSRIATSGTPSV